MEPDAVPAATPAELDDLEARITAWLAGEAATNPVIAAVDRGEPGERRWYVRLLGEEKDVTTIWLTLGQRTLHYETYVMPAPEEGHAAFYEYLLRRNHGLHGAAFTIGVEDAVFLEGRVDLASVDDAVLDRIVGTLYATVERCFRPLLRIGFASRLAR